MPIAQRQRSDLQPVAVGDGRPHADEITPLHFRPKLHAEGDEFDAEIVRRAEIHQQEEVGHVAYAHQRGLAVGQMLAELSANAFDQPALHVDDVAGNRLGKSTPAGLLLLPAALQEPPVDDHQPLDRVGQLFFGQDGVAQLRVHAARGPFTLLDTMAFVVGAEHHHLRPC